MMVSGSARTVMLVDARYGGHAAGCRQGRRLGRRALQAALTAYPGTIVLDLTGMTYLSSEGMAALVDATIRAHDAGIEAR